MRDGCFVENDREATACIRENLERTKLFETAEVMQKDVLQRLKRWKKRKKSFDIIFMDPPYDRLFEKKGSGPPLRFCADT